jgi:hypothetical protein
MFLCLHARAQQASTAAKAVDQSYNLVVPQSRDTQYYEMSSTLLKHALDGKVIATDVYRLWIRCVPAKTEGQPDSYTCLRFTVQSNDGPARQVPALANWTYRYTRGTGLDERGQVFGIDHAQFEKLKDDKDIPLILEQNYHVYNAFIDFHALGMFLEKTVGDSGIQDLRRIGQRIVHASAFSQPPVNLGATVMEGSYFQNGLVTLEFKGIGTDAGRPCAIIGYDSGESSFFMRMAPMPNMQVDTRGKSHYWGDIWKDLGSGWMRRADLREIVISETTIAGQKTTIPAVVERRIEIRAKTKPGI